MYLKYVEVKNFRKLVKTTCKFNPGLNLIVGSNDSGKSAIIDAIRMVLKQIVDDYSRISLEDFNDLTQQIEIKLVFSFDNTYDEELTEECSKFAEYLSFNDNDQPELIIWYSVKGNENDIRFPEFKVGPSINVASEMDARCRENLKVVYLRPLRDAEYELKARPGSRISKILSKHPDIKSSEVALVTFLKEFKEKAEKFFDKENGKSLTTEVKRLLSLFDEQSLVQNKEIKIGPTEKLDLIKTLEKIALYYSEVPLPGLGTLNMIFIAAELLHLKTQSLPKLILIEEVEAHLHPQRQLKIIKALQEESKSGIQMLVSTHSPNLASIIEVERLIISINGTLYSLAKGETKLEDKNYTYLKRFLDVTKANLFFSQGNILVEGPTEQMLVPEFAKILGYDLTDYGVSVTSTNNLGFENFVNIFKRENQPYNQIPIAVITDADRKNSAELSEYATKIKDENNKIGCFISNQIYSDQVLDTSEMIRSTFEKTILNNTSVLKQLYISAYNDLKIRKEPMDDTMDLQKMYKKLVKEKAPIAQEVAQRLSEITDKNVIDQIKKEISDNLKYIHDAIKFSLKLPIENITENTKTTLS